MKESEKIYTDLKSKVPNLFKLKSSKQIKQQELSWKLKVVMGAIGNLYPRESSLSTDISI